MNIIEKEMDVYEIAHNLYTNTEFTHETFTIHNDDLKNYFEMLIIILTEGLKHFYGEDDKVNLTQLSINDFNKLKEYFKKINIEMNLQIFTIIDWVKNRLYTNYIPYDKIIINNNTKLEELNFIINPDTIDSVYIINFKFLMSS